MAAVFLGMMMAGAANACTKPSFNAAIPDGQGASEDEMLSTQQAVNRYLDDMNTYLECLDQRMSTPHDTFSHTAILP